MTLSPIWAQQAVVATYGWWWYRRRFSSHFHQFVDEFREREFWTKEQFRCYQEIQLRKILNAAWKSSYYRTAFLEARVSEKISSLEDLSRLPFLEKESLRTRARDLLTEPSIPVNTYVQRTSGTTGTPNEICYSPDFHAFELAVPEVRSLNRAGVTYRDRRVMFGVRKVCRFDQKKPPFWRFSPAEDMAYASIYHLSPELLPHYTKFLRSYQPRVMMGCPSALHTIAQYALESGDLPAPAKAVFTTSEAVTTQAREAIEQAWQCRVYDRYGAVEGCASASQCEHGRYHVSPEVGIIEIVDSEGRHCPPGVMGEMICTGLQNTLQPLIRYRIGDAARWATTQKCECGREQPILESVEGRFEDICYTPDGRQMLRFDSVFKGIANIKEAQIVQESLDSFIINLVPAASFSEQDVQRITSNMRLHVGEVHTRVEIVSAIPRSSSGKFRAVLCKLSLAEKARLQTER